MFKHSEAPGLKNLYVIAVVSNPARFASRYRLFEAFRKQVDGKANLFTVELALGDRPFECNADLELRSFDELWHKENMINLAIQRLPSDWEYVAWVDADIAFCRDDWAEEIVHQLQHHHVIQLFQNAIDLGPHGEVIQVHNGFVWSWATGQPPSRSANGGYNYGNWHPGYAWAARREAIEALGGLFDLGILGAGDHHMAHALLGKVHERVPPFLSDGYVEALEAWQQRANVHIRQDLGFMPGTIHHAWHGPKRKRFYGERWEILRKHGYDPRHHIKRDSQGLLAFTHAGEVMRNDIRQYFKARDEDDIRAD